TREGGAGAVLEGPGAARVEEFLRRLVPPLARPGAQPQAPGPGQRQAGPAAPEPQVGPFQPARGAVSPFFLVAARLGEEPEPGPLKGLGPEAGGQGVPQLPFGGPSKAGPGVGAGDLVLEDLAVERPPAPECSIPRAPAALHRALVAHVLVEVGALLPPPALGAGAQPQGAQLLPQAQVGPFLEKGLSFLPPPLLVTPYAHGGPILTVGEGQVVLQGPVGPLGGGGGSRLPVGAGIDRLHRPVGRGGQIDPGPQAVPGLGL